MHVITLLKTSMFDIQVRGRPASVDAIFPDWHPHDRFGIVIDEPLGGIGATHLIQLATTLFYDVKPARRSERKVYPEIYAIHRGRGHGAHAPYDFWPARREAIIDADHRAALDAINDRGITRLAVPDRPARNLEHRPKEVDAALDRIVSSIVYDPSGRVECPDFSISGNDKRTEHNADRVLRGPATPVPVPTASGVPIKEVDPAYLMWLREREPDVSHAERAQAGLRRDALRTGGLATETYRFALVTDALSRL